MASSPENEKPDFTGQIAKVALALPNFPDRQKGTSASESADEWRFGTGGSLAINLRDDTWYDHEDQNGGGVYDLVAAFVGKAKAWQWLVDNGFQREKPKANGEANGHAAGEKFAGFMDHWPIATFVYNDDRGRLAYEVLKFAKDAPRRYMQRRPHPSGRGWIWGLQGGLYGRTRSGDWFKAKAGKKYEAEENFQDAVRWLYHRDEVLAAKKAGKPICLCEGEKDVETLREWGFAATTNAGGAKYWTEAFDEDLAGADVIILPDNDDAGRQRAMVRGAGLRKQAKSVRILDLARHWAEIPEKADVTDWKEQAGGTVDQFADLVAHAPLWQPERPKSRYGAMHWDQLDDPGPELEYLIDGLLTVGERSVVAGPSRSGKSFLSIHMAFCVARGVPFFGCDVRRSGVIYQAGEGARGVKKRMRAYRKHFGIPRDEDVPFVLLQSQIDLYSHDGDTQPLIEEIRAQALCLGVPLGLVVIDTLATATAGADENSGKDMGVVLANIARIAKECDCHVMLVHHMNAAGKKIRGHTSIFGNVDQVIEVTWNEEKSKVRTARLTKQKDDEDGLAFPFKLRSVELGQKPNGKAITSCIVESVNEGEKLEEEGKQYGFSVKPSEEKILIPLFKAIERYGRFVTGEGAGDPAEAKGKHVVDFEYYLDIAVEMDTEDDDKSKARDRLRQYFKRNSNFLVKAGIIVFQRPFIWWTGKPIRGFPHTFPEEMRSRTFPGHFRDISGTFSDLSISPGMAELMDMDGETLL